MVRPSRRPGRRRALPRFGRARPRGRPRRWQRHAYAGVRPTEVVVPVVQGQLLASSLCALAQGRHPPSDRRDRLTAVQVQALDERGGDRPATGGSHLLNGLTRAEHHTGLDVDPALAPPGLHHLGLQPPWQRHPAGLGSRTCGVAPRRVHPPPAMGEPRGRLRLAASGQAKGDAARRQPLDHRRDPAWRHGQRAVAAVERQQQRALGGDGRPDPARRA
jgi:hypothetical protein